MRGGFKQCEEEKKEKKKKAFERKIHGKNCQRPETQRRKQKHRLSALTFTTRGLIGSEALDAQLELRRDEYSRTRGKQESMQRFRPAINSTYCITGLSLRTGASKQHEIEGAERKSLFS